MCTAGKPKVAGLIPCGDIYFHFELFACFPSSPCGGALANEIKHDHSLVYKYHIFTGWHYINITFFTGWRCRLSPRGNIVDRGGAEVDNAFRGVTIYHINHPVKNVIFILLYRMSHFYNKFTVVRHCRVTFKIVTRPIDQSDCLKLTWGKIMYIVTPRKYCQPRWLFEGWKSTMSPCKECYIYFI